MMKIYGLPQPLSGAEIVTIQQEQNGNIALCSMPISALASVLTLNYLATNLPSIQPATPGIVWNNGGVISISQ